jgi:hypothetical protein
MSDSSRPGQTKRAGRAAREARLAEALRDNLRRRKEQARDRAAHRDTPDAPADPGSRRREDASLAG